MRIKKIVANRDGWSDWIQPIRKGYRMKCCDCGLIHLLDFRIVGKRAQFRTRRSGNGNGVIVAANNLTDSVNGCEEVSYKERFVLFNRLIDAVNKSRGIE